MEALNPGCPCLYLKEPCNERCSCKNIFQSFGCLNCATYGSLEQKTAMAEYLNNARLAYEKTFEVKPVDSFISWFHSIFEYVTEEEGNGESIDVLNSHIDKDGATIIEFSVDCHRAGIHRGNTIKISKDKIVKVSLVEIIDSGGIPRMLKEEIEKKLKE